MRGWRHYFFYVGTHSSGITVPVNSQESGWGGEEMTEQRVREKKAAFMNSPRQGRMVLFYKSPTTNAKHAHPKLEGEGKSSQGTTADKGW